MGVTRDLFYKTQGLIRNHWLQTGPLKILLPLCTKHYFRQTDCNILIFKIKKFTIYMEIIYLKFGTAKKTRI